MLPDLLAALHLLFNHFQLLQWQLEVMVAGHTFFRDDFMGFLQINNHEHAFRHVTGEAEVFEVSIEVYSEHFGNVYMAKRVEYCVAFLPISHLYVFVFIKVMLQHNFSVIINMEDEDIDTQHLRFGRIPSEAVFPLRIKDELERLSYNAIFLFF
jgi:hypothetical protein